MRKFVLALLIMAGFHGAAFAQSYENGNLKTVIKNTSAAPVYVDGSNVTQPVSAVSLPLPSGAATSVKQPALGTAGTPSSDVITIQGKTSMTPVLVDGSGATQPISGTITASQGTASSLNATVVGTGTFATQATLQAGTAYAGKVRLTDGTNDTTFSTAGADAVSNTLNRMPVFSYLMGYNGSTWDRMLVDTNKYLYTTIGSALPAGTAYIGKFRLTDGTRDASLLNLTNSKPLPVGIVDGNGDQITSFGGGTQYTEGDTDASITGTAMLWEDGSDTLRSVSSAKPLPVNVVSGSAAGTEYVEDAAAASDPQGPMSMAVRRDSLSGSEVSADGDNIALKASSKGELYVKQTDTVPVTKSGTWDITNAGTFAVQSTMAASVTSPPKTEDVASAGADVGIPAMAIQAATPADTAADQDYSMLQMSAGRLWVDASGKTLTVASHAVTNAGTFATQSAITAASASVSSGAFASGSIASGALASGSIASGALASGSIAAGAFAAGATSIAENEDVANADADRGIKILAVQQSTPADTGGTNGDYMMPQMSAGRIWAAANIDKINNVTPLMGTGNTGTGSIRVTIATDQAQLTNKLLVTPDANSAVNVAQINGVTALMGNGTTGTGSQRVTIASDNTAFAVNAAVTMASGATASPAKAEDLASGSVDVGEYILGVRADNITAATTNTDGDYTQINVTKYGNLINQPFASTANYATGVISTSMTGTTSTSLVAASGNASTKLYVTSLICTCDHATQGTNIKFQDGSGGTTLWFAYAAPTGGGFAMTGTTPLFWTTANTALFVANVTTGSSTTCSASGYYAP